MDAKQEAHRERGELADFLEGLSEDQWATPSLCAGWTVQDVVAHVVSYDELTALVDGLIHHQDIRRPLGQPREIPRDRLRFVLNTAWTAPLIRGFWHARGVRLAAEDVGWSRGGGPEARGPAEAVLMTVAGRRGVARELTGPGVDVLTTRLG